MGQQRTEIRTFISEYDFTGKTVIPFCSHDGYGAGSSFTTIQTLSGATVLDGFAIRGTQVSNAQSDVNSWLERIGIEKPSVQTNIVIDIGDELTVRVADNERKILIAYFTLSENISFDGITLNSGASICTSGNVSALARYIQEYAGGELFSITVKNPYPNNYGGCLEKVIREKEQNTRPELANTVKNMDEYDVVFLGYPNWSYTVPMAIKTFLQSYNFSGKTVIPFCSHGTGGIENTVSDIRSQIPDATVLSALGVSRDDVNNCQSKIHTWLKSLGF